MRKDARLAAPRHDQQNGRHGEGLQFKAAARLDRRHPSFKIRDAGAYLAYACPGPGVSMNQIPRPGRRSRSSVRWGLRINILGESDRTKLSLLHDLDALARDASVARRAPMR